MCVKYYMKSYCSIEQNYLKMKGFRKLNGSVINNLFIIIIILQLNLFLHSFFDLFFHEPQLVIQNIGLVLDKSCILK